MNALKKEKSFILVLLLSISALSPSCTKNETPPPPEEYHISENFKRYTVFAKGSYWIYERKSPQPIAYDTVVVESTKLEKRVHSLGGNQYYYDAIEFGLSSKELGFLKGEITSGPDSYSGEKAETYRLFFANGTYLSILIPHHPIDSLIHLGGTEGDYLNKAFYSEFSLNQNFYSDVYETQVVENPASPQSIVYHFFLAKDYGLIGFSSQNFSNGLVEEWALKSASLYPLDQN